MPPFAQGNPLGPVFGLFVLCWADAVHSERPDDVEQKWRKQWADVLRPVRAVYVGAGDVHQREFIAAVRDYAGDWADWLIIRLSMCTPFARWAAWQAISHLAAGPAVGQDMEHGYILPLRVFVLPRELLPGRTLSSESYERRDPQFWPHGTPATRVIRRVPGLLRLCWLRTFLIFAVEPLPLSLLALTMVSLVGMAIWGNRSEAALQVFLAAGASMSACLACLAAWEAIREIWLVWQEGWFHFWKDSLIRIVGDPRQPVLLDGDSHGVAVLFDAFAALTERVQRENPGRLLESRLSGMMLRLAEKRGWYGATGRLAGPFGIQFGNVGDIRKKHKAVDGAHLPQFLVPLTPGNIRQKLRVCRKRRARLRLRLFVPAAAMKLSGVFRANTLIGAALVCVVFVATPDEWRMVKRIYPPQPDGPARWSPRISDTRPADFLQLTFQGVSGNPGDYFVIVAGAARSTAGPEGDRVPPDITVNGQTRLKEDPPGSGVIRADVSLKAIGGMLDPHRLSVELYQRRSILGLNLPPIRVSTFGVPDVEILRGRP